MSEELALRLPNKLFLRETGRRPLSLELGRLSIAGFTELAIYLPPSFRPGDAEVWAWPRPLLLVDGHEGGQRIKELDRKSGEYAPYYGLEPDDRSGQWLVYPTWATQVYFPAEAGRPTSQTSKIPHPASGTVYLFDNPIAYEQAVFSESVYGTLERAGLQSPD